MIFIWEGNKIESKSCRHITIHSKSERSVLALKTGPFR